MVPYRVVGVVTIRWAEACQCDDEEYEEESLQHDGWHAHAHERTIVVNRTVRAHDEQHALAQTCEALLGECGINYCDGDEEDEDEELIEWRAAPTIRPASEAEAMEMAGYAPLFNLEAV